VPDPIRTEWTFVVADSLEKVFADEVPRPLDWTIPITAFANETVSFQVAFLPPTASSFDELGELRVELEAAAFSDVKVSSVDLVPCTLLAFDGHDEGYLRDTAGLYPDLLRPLDGGKVMPFLGQWRAIWITVTAPQGMSGALPVGVTIHSETTGAVLFATTVEIQVSPLQLPPLDIVNTHWFHCDGLADFYDLETFSEEHWRVIGRFIAKAAEMDVNSVLTPTWTPPLDTAVGGMRRPIQLVDIAEVDGEYRFGFEKLERWMKLCRTHGITHLEIAHLFTQWGAEFAPAIYVQAGRNLERRFGWHTRATDPDYRRLLEALLPAMLAVLDRQWGLDRVIFHISDEPHGPDMLASYMAARAVVDDLLSGCTIIDALSDFDFYSSGAVETPVVATDAVDPFLQAGVENLWVYYCVNQSVDVANRFISMPSTRNRVIGGQIFMLGIAGFLHWGYNFYNSELSTKPIDPFTDTCAGGAYPAGDAFIVYPGEGGEPYESIRFRVFAEAMTDHRAMQALRDLAGLEVVRGIVDPDSTLTLTRYSADPNQYRRVRAELSAEILRQNANR
jgi:hypothetical protein